MRKPYNVKKFLVENSHRSMACYHAKVMDDGIMKLTIHDCKGSIQLHNNLDNEDEVHEAIEKLETLGRGIFDLQLYIARSYLKSGKKTVTDTDI